MSDKIVELMSTLMFLTHALISSRSDTIKAILSEGIPAITCFALTLPPFSIPLASCLLVFNTYLGIYTVWRPLSPAVLLYFHMEILLTYWSAQCLQNQPYCGWNISKTLNKVSQRSGSHTMYHSQIRCFDRGSALKDGIGAIGILVRLRKRRR